MKTVSDTVKAEAGDVYLQQRRRRRHTAPAPSSLSRRAARSRGYESTDSHDDQTLDAKHSLGFILDVPAGRPAADRHCAATSGPPAKPPLDAVPPSDHKIRPAGMKAMTIAATGSGQPVARPSVKSAELRDAATSSDPPTHRAEPSNAKWRVPATAATAKTSEEKRRARKCIVDGCANYTINKGRCFRHGGGKRCSEYGCNASAKVAGLCWKHGGSMPCTREGCDRRGKSRGLCWAHGGGSKCTEAGCGKVAVSNSCCWAHGGGKRCQFDGCQRPAYERTFNYCPKHFERLKNGDEVMEV